MSIIKSEGEGSVYESDEEEGRDTLEAGKESSKRRKKDKKKSKKDPKKST